MVPQHGFNKQERLCSRSLIDTLFARGEKLLVFPFSVRWMICPQDTFVPPSQVLIATSKKKFHHAVDRNRVKRLMRECYRLQKPQWYQFLDDNNLHVALSINYIHDEIFDFSTLQRKYDKLQDKLQKQISQSL